MTDDPFLPEEPLDPDDDDIDEEGLPDTDEELPDVVTDPVPEE